MKTLNLEFETLNLRWAVVVLSLMICNNCPARIQQAWVAHYNNGITNGTNQAVKMALDASGNIYVTGFSENANSNLGYVTIKYAANGNQLWATRYDSTNYLATTPVSLALDSSDNVIVTGNASTIKYDTNGSQLWIEPYAGTSLAVDTDGNCVVTGISTSFGTVKLNPNGSNVWLATYPSSYGPGVGQQVLIASDNSIYVAGYYTFLCQESMCYQEMLLIKYSSAGNQLWTVTYDRGSFYSVQVGGARLDNEDNLYMVVNFPGNLSDATFKYATDGALVWTTWPDNGTGPANALALDNATNVLLVGQDAYAYDGAFNYYWTTFTLDSSGTTMRTNHYPQPPFGSSVATAISVDSANNSYVTGYSPGTNANNDIVTIKYDHNGNQKWLQRYSSPGNGNAAGNSVAVDNNGNVYVAGYDTTTAGGTEMVLIKYSPVTLQRKPDGTVLLQTQGSPGESFDIEASTDLQSWLDLGNVLADTNGLMQFDDTNATNFPSRFYYTNPQ